jgi:hypothetical protein
LIARLAQSAGKETLDEPFYILDARTAGLNGRLSPGFASALGHLRGLPTPTALAKTPAAPFTFSGQKKTLLLAIICPGINPRWSMAAGNSFMPQKGDQGEWQNIATH